ncbi:MAG: LolA family protein [Rickettsiales bacterium]
MFKLIYLYLLLVASSVWANPLTKSELEMVENYLNYIKTAEAEFIQLNNDGSLNEGKFYLKKPGKFRWEYYDQPIIVVANGKSLIYYDSELEQSNYVAIENSIATLITRKKIKFNADLELIKAEKRDGIIFLTAIKSEQKDVGSFSFVFAEKPLELKKIEFIDANQNKISVSFLNLNVNANKIYEDSMFMINDSRFK